MLLTEDKSVRVGRGMVATSHPAAVQAGLDALDAGGSAADAAVAAAAMLCVVDPRSTGIGGDLFALYWEPEASLPVGLEGAGVAPQLLTLDALREASYEEMPADGPWTVTVPGSVAAWESLLQRFGRLDLAYLLASAIACAEQGFDVSPIVGEEWATCVAKLDRDEAARTVFLVDRRAPHPGEKFKNPDLASTLSVLAEGGADVFYRGDIGRRIGEAVAAAGGPLRAGDLASWGGPSWTTPISRDYGGVDLYELPPPGQGIVTLQALAIYEGFEASSTEDQEHLAIEAMKLAFADARAYVSDPLHEHVAVESLLSEPYLAGRRLLVDPHAATVPAPGPAGDTVYVAAADADGGACSLIQSLYEGFGSGIVVPGTGIALQNRGANFIMDDQHPNRPAPGKRPYHTIIPAMLGRAGMFHGCLGVVGGFMQPQGQFQIVRNVVDRGMSPQDAIDAPRWRVQRGRVVGVEEGFDDQVVSSLRARDHDVQSLPRFEAGGAQMILRSQDGYLGGSDSRKDGIVGAQ